MSTFAVDAIVYKADGEEVDTWDSADLMRIGIDNELVHFIGAMTGECVKGKHYHPAFAPTRKSELSDKLAKTIRRDGFNRNMYEEAYIVKIDEARRFATERLCHGKDYINPCTALEQFTEDFVDWLKEVTDLDGDFLVIWVSP